jgi:hypothetical protein
MVLIHRVNVKLPLSSNGFVPDCCLMMVIVIVLCTGSRCDQIRWKDERVIYEFGIQGFPSCLFDVASSFKILKSLSAVHSRNVAAQSTSRGHNS